MESAYVVKSSKTFKFNKIKKIPGKKRQVSIVLPTYNEKDNIGRLVEALKSALNSINYEIVIVDDNSKDGTSNIIDKLACDRVIAVHRYNEKGIFSALKNGIFLSHGEYFVTMDADLSHPPTLIREFLKYKDKYDIVSGSRFAKGGGMKAPFQRKLGSLVINRFSAFIMGLPLTDVAGGFHLIRKDKFNKIKFRYISSFGEFDFELLFRAYKLGFKMKEIPFIYKFRDSGESKMGTSDIFSLLKNTYNYFHRAFQLRFE